MNGIIVYSHNSIQRLSNNMNIDIDSEGDNLTARLVMRGVSNEAHIGIC